MFSKILVDENQKVKEIPPDNQSGSPHLAQLCFYIFLHTALFFPTLLLGPWLEVILNMEQKDGEKTKKRRRGRKDGDTPLEGTWKVLQEVLLI